MFTLKKTLQHYLTINYQYEPKTRKIYLAHVGRLIDYLGNQPIDKIEPVDIAGFMGSLRKKNGKPYAPGYLSQVYRTIHALFNFCVEEEFIPRHPMRRLKPPPVPVGPKPRLSLKQVQALLNAVGQTEASTRNLAIVLLMVDCGLRAGEVAGLTASSLHLEDQTITVYAPKTHTSREIPITDMASLSISTYLKKNRPPFNKITDPLFLLAKGKNKNSGISGETIAKLMTRLKKNVDFPLHAHLLRHTFANHFNRQASLRYLQKILGHTRIETTARFYTDPEIADMLTAIKRAAPTAQINSPAGR